MSSDLVTVEIRWRRGSYLARIDGTDDRYGLRRDFETGHPVKSRGVLVYDLAPGWYEYREGRGERVYLRVDTLTAEVMPSAAAAFIDVASTGPDPGEPGEWYGPVCECGAETTRFDPDGWPRCADHETADDPYGVPANLPVPA